MKTNFLFPHRYKKIGWILFVPVFILSILWVIFEFKPEFLNVKVIALFNSEFFEIIENNIAAEILGILLIISSLLIAFSKERNEDEFISKIRLDSLVWATYVNYAILILAFIFIYNMIFFWVAVFNMFTILIFFIIRYNWALYKLKKSMSHEE